MSTDTRKDSDRADEPSDTPAVDDRSTRQEKIARQALAEAQARRKALEHVAQEIGGRGGLDPVRYGDWEIKGLASDF